MTESKRPLRVFLCHAHADRDAVKALYIRLTKDGVDAWLDKENRLTKDGVDAWLDKEKLLPGQDWELEIRKAVREADVVVVCLSKQFNQAGFRQKEVRLALDTAMEQPEGEIFIIPARLEECDTLESLRKWHWVDLFEGNGYEMLMRALRARADKVGVNLRLEKDWLSGLAVSSKDEESSYEKQVIGKGRETIAPKELKHEKSESKRLRIFRKLNITVFVSFVVLLGTVIIVLSNSTLIEKWNSLVHINTELAAEITDANGVQMVLVPAGEFTMGSESGYEDERPAHTLSVDDFYIDKYEVTNLFYKACVDAGVCESPMDLRHYDNSRYNNHPVVFVNWYMAGTYCTWRDARLPTEAEWEKAARGDDRRIYSWGNDFDPMRANVFLSGLSDTNAVGMYENGKSPFGIYDLTGNVREWTSSLYQPYPYVSKDGREDQMSTDERVIRGGSFDNSDVDTRTTSRFPFKPSEFSIGDGFRCAKDAP